MQISNQNSNFSEYLVYIEGASTAKVVTVAAGSTALIAFPQVADLGEGVLQLAVATNGSMRWFDASVAVDVTPSENVHAGTLSMAGSGFAAYGATHVSWSPDGARLAYQLGQGRLWQVGIDAPLLSEGGPTPISQSTPTTTPDSNSPPLTEVTCLLSAARRQCLCINC